MTTTWRTVRIARKVTEALDICSFELVDPAGASLPAFAAGSHIDVDSGSGIVRQYSLCNDPSESHRYLIAVVRDPSSRGGSLAMHALAEGQTIRISEPKNHFALEPNAEHSVLVAGGIGITPLLCMAERLNNIGASFELHYCTRSRERTAFLERLQNSPLQDRVHLHFDDGPADQKFEPNKHIGPAARGSHMYVCGPTGFMDWVLDSALALAWQEPTLHREYFAAKAADTSNDGSFEVQIASTGAVIVVAPDQSVVAALADAGIDVETSCEQGVCGTCVTRVLEGTPDHRDMYFTSEEQAKCDQFTPCCSRAKSSRLVLDL